MKHCTKCGEARPLSAFNKDSRRAMGVRPECKSCRAKSRDYALDAETRKGYQREWRRRNPERVRAYRQQDKARPRDYLTQWRAAQG